MVTFGDMMALLLTFFVLLLSFSQMDLVKFEEAAGSLRDAFGLEHIERIPPRPTAPDMNAINFTDEVIIVQLSEKLHKTLMEQIQEGDAAVDDVDEGLLIRLSADALFLPDSTRIRPEMASVLREMTEHVAKIENLIHITGFTDNQPSDPSSPYPTTWARAGDMAAALTDFFVTKGSVSPPRLETRSRAEFFPRASNDTPSDRARNRRVEVLISRETEPTNINPYLEKEQIEAPPPPPILPNG
jgi:chemotaxis protein MotB